MDGLRALARAAVWPARRILDPRFADVNRRIHLTREEIATTRAAVGSVSSDVGGYAATSVESMTFLGDRLRALEASVDGLPEELVARLAQAYIARIDAQIGGGVASLDGVTAALINHAESHKGFAAQRELWLNPSISLEHREGDVRLGEVNERIVEVPFAVAALHDVNSGAAVLDFGASESSLSLSLASLGYHVTALDIRPYPFTHPLLESVTSRLEDWDPGERRYAAVVCVSTVEHVGLGSYGRESLDVGGDRRALQRLLELTDPGGLLVLTVPYGQPSVDQFQRRYDRAALDALVEGWDEIDRHIVERVDNVTWCPVDDSDGHAVALLTARAPRQA